MLKSHNSNNKWNYSSRNAVNRRHRSKVAPKKLAPQARLDMIIAIIKDNPLITREEIAKALGVGHTTIQNDLRILKEQYGLRYEGSSKTGQWVIEEKEEQ